MTQPDIVIRYAELKAKAKAIEAELEILAPEVLIKVMAIRGDTDQPVEIPQLGSYTVIQKKDWQFTPAVEELTTQLKQLKADEQRLGLATYQEHLELRFSPQKG